MPAAVVHHAAVRSPFADPSELQRIAAARTLMWPVLNVPRAPPSNPTRRSLASTPEVEGQGWPALQTPSISRAAIPARRIFGPSAHQIGPSPSHTAVGVQVKLVPAATTWATIARIIRNLSRRRRDQDANHSREFPPGVVQRPWPLRPYSSRTLRFCRLKPAHANERSTNWRRSRTGRDGNDSRRSCNYCGSLEPSARRRAQGRASYPVARRAIAAAQNHQARPLDSLFE